MNKSKTQFLVKVAVLGALAAVLMYFEFPLPVAPPFYKVDFSDTAALVGAFAMGPWAAVLISLIKNILHIILKGTSTAYVGELANFLVSCAFTCTASIIYQKKHTKKGALISLIAGTLALAAAGAFVNYFVVIPAYVKFMNIPLDVIVGMGGKIFPAVTSLFTFVLLCTTPFNLIKGVLLSIVTMIVYKRISPILKK
ncbi:MAG: ECF transporter S component [Erysipelotrichaceae bacterium]|nr:ECF transporter S component [Erysipelotrichaceae bacterium]